MRLIDVDALKKELRMADRCEDCERNARDCRYVYGHTRMDICEMLDDAPTVGGWISVQDKLPEEGGEYIAFDGETVFGAYYEIGTTGTRWTDATEGYYDFKVTHWMPLPEPPKERKTEEEDRSWWFSDESPTPAP